MTVKHEHVLIGLPETGKTTFLAALWHALNSANSSTDLRLERFHDDHEYLNSIRERWVNAEIQDRTVPSAETQVSMILAGDAIEGELEVCIPDLSGESYESIWSYRKLNRERAEAIIRAEGILLFVHPDQVEKEILISETAEIVEELEDDGDVEEDAAELAEWDAQKSPTQVQLLDLLQCVLRLNANRPLRLGVVVSAWDRIDAVISPSDWIKRELPLLWQFLQCNDDCLESAFFGVSAQGGQLPRDADRLRELDRPIERIQIVCAGGETGNDITTPLRWLMTAVDR